MELAMAMAMAMNSSSGSSLMISSSRTRIHKNGAAVSFLSMPRSRFVVRRISCSSQGDASPESKSIRFTVEAHAGDESEPPKLVIELPVADAPGDGHVDVSEQSITNVASESAVESPENVHGAAEQEAARAVAGGEGIEEVAEEIEKEASKVSLDAAEHSLSDSEETIAAAADGDQQNDSNVIESVSSGLEMAKEAVNKRAKVFAMAAEEAGQKGGQFVDAARKGIQDLKQKLETGISSLNQQQSTGGEQQQQHSEQEEEEKHSAVDVDDVNKDGEAALNKQRDIEEQDSEAGGGGRGGAYDEAVIKKVMHEFVEPALEAMPGELDEQVELGDGNEHLKNMNDLEKHDSYAPIEE